jgi:predicted AlkP superfamily phosphohydrolase/phosphomutase
MARRSMKYGRFTSRVALAAIAVLMIGILVPSVSYAYIGPGAGFAFGASLGVFIAAIILPILFFLTWPVRYVIRKIKCRGRGIRGDFDRVIVVGFDGLDPGILEKLMSENKLPNIAGLIEQGSFRWMRSTCPPISPVAWSSFSTGVNPGKHNIFDFLAPERSSYMSKLSSADIRPPTRWLPLGKFRIPLNKPTYRPMRKSKPFWTVLSENCIFSSVIRVPITFPPDKFGGLLLSSLCVPDLRGTQGSFSYYSTNKEALGKYTGGFAYELNEDRGAYTGDLIGPENVMVKDAPPLKLPFKIKPNGNGDSATLTVGREKCDLKMGKHSPWVTIEFSAGLGIKVRGISRFILKSLKPDVELYVTPINVDPEKPAIPISNPGYYASYLSKLLGPYATLGLAEDTWALNERIIDEEQFLEQSYLINEERERMLFNELDRVKKGAVVCVFDITDRVQHMLWRYTDPDHPANRDKESTKHADAIEKLYIKVDETVARLQDYVDDKTAFILMSDHGFKAFRRGVNLNSWLMKEGYLHLKEGAEIGDWFEGVDWTRTRAYALGLGGIFINLKGRESQGIVERDEVPNLVMELKDLLTGLTDEATGKTAIKTAYDATEVYSGPYIVEGPDLIVGFSAGYRASWEGVTGKVTGEVFTDNTKAWSGDHCMDPTCVPAVLITNRKIESNSPSIQDIAPSILNLFGVKPPPYMDGQPIIK